MKVAVALILCAITLARGQDVELNGNGCPIDYTHELLYAHEICNKFYQCTHGELVVHKCAGDLLFNVEKQECDWPHDTDCGHRIIPGPESEENEVEVTTEPNTSQEGEGGSDNGGDDNGSGDSNTTCNCNPGEAPAICAGSDSEGKLIAHENCNQFYKCSDGIPVAISCYGDLMYNPYSEVCDWPQNVDCGERVIPDCDDNNENSSDENNNGDSGDNGNGDNNTTCNCNPGDAPSICAGSESEGVLIAHENCNQFYKCSDGVPVAMSCYGELLYNPYTEQCDWPTNVDCGDRVIPECDEDNNNNGENGNGDNNNGENGSDGDNNSGGSENGGNSNENGTGSCNCNPGEAPTICAGSESEGVLIAHENCNQFYKCSYGVPVAMSCYGDLLYNPYTEQCDWPTNVDCGDRVIPECDEDNNNNGENGNGDNNNGENGSGDNNNGENGSDGDNNSGGNENGGNSNENGTGSCNCNPGEASTICAGSESEGVLIAHENCNQFYKCSHGVPVAMSCYGDLLYNPYTEQCDWPTNVDCGDRVIPECDEENNNNGENGNGDNNNGENGSGDNNNGENGSDGDNNSGGNENGGNSNENGTGSCNCNPGEASTICAGSESEGVLIAHENCNQFYKCSHGVPVAMSCYGDLLYNPYTEQCDWPTNVDCGDRVIPECDEDNNNNGENGNGDNNNGENGSDGDNNSGGNENGGNSNENGTGSCNCNSGEAPTICAGSESEGVLIAHENCNQFYKCSHGVPVAMSCYGGLLYNPYTEQCDWPTNVDCGDRVIPECDEDNNNNGENGNGDNNNGENGSGDNNNGENGSDGDNNSGGNGNGGNSNENGTGSCNCNPGEAPTICAGSESEGVLIAHENCNQFYKCSHGVPVAMSCYGDLLYNPYTEQCDWPTNVDCGDRVIPECDEDNNNNGENGNGDNNNGENGSGDNNNGENGSGDNNNGENGSGGDNNNGSENETGSCNCNPGEAPTICAGIGSEGTLIAHENCNQFYICSHGVPVAMKCYGDLLYNPYIQRCDWAYNVECGDRVIPECDDDNKNNGDNNSNGDNNNGENAAGDNNNGESGSDGDNNNGGNGNGDNGNENETGSCNCNPGEAPTICAGIGSEGTLIAHENCNQFYICSHGVPVAMKCYGDLLYNPYIQRCDWAYNVECGDRVIPECDDDDNNNGDNNSNGDNNNGENASGDNNNGESGSDGDNNNGGNGNGDNGTGSCNCNPGEAPFICAGSGSEGVLIAHENCNQFYKCANGVPVALSCYGDLLYNPYTEQCDWPANVECGDRVIPECDDDNNNNGDNNSNGDNNNGENGSGDNNNGESGSDGDNNNGGNGNGDNGTGSCNCNPGEAPSICAGSGSEGVLIAHENCNQFYKCANGVPVALSCYGDLLYNPYTEQCDWPANVECGDRVIPECDDDNNNNGDNNSNGDNNNGENGSGDNNNGESGSGGDNNNGGNGNGDNGNDNGTGSCNCNPGEAPSICAGSGSEGVLIAHENCNQFYKCANGVPVALSCYGDLLYNPYTEQCDWPANVECGDRVIPECDDDDNNNGDNNSNGDNNNGENASGDNNNGESGSDGDNNNGDNGNGDNGTGSCNCNPGEAPSICAGSGSEGVLIAHENCNQFYKCANGVPVALSCYGDLLYNPYTEQCDWPANVECGDRVIPECDDDNNNNGDNNSNGDNNNGENGSGDNNNGESGSDGVNNNGGNGNGDNGTGSCNCNPGEAPSICAGSGSEGVLIAHENCNQFYKCANGVPVALSCYGDLLYNPYTEQCDWPANVECGDRVIPECDDDDNNNGDNNSNGDNNNGENASGDNNNGESGSDGDNNNGDNGNGDNGTGSCNCNPGEAPSICAGSGSEGVLIAHENCNQFYKCANGVPVALSCYGDLLYNPYTEQCDWPEKVDCDKRVIPVDIEDNKDEKETEIDNEDCDGDVPDVCKSEGSDGLFVAHENCNQFYVCSDLSATILDCPGVLLYDVVSHKCEWPALVDCDGRNVVENEDNGNSNGGCNCNPLQAPVLCAHEDSDGELIAHENCDQFYKCSAGIPVTFNCTATLLYNPYKQVCDWPENVDCNGRSLSYFSSMNKHLNGRKLQASKA